MAITYSLEEILTFAVKIEEQGMAFYAAVAKKGRNKDAQDLYRYLHDEEVKHRETYRGMLEELHSGASPDADDAEYSGYLRALVESTVFRKEDISSLPANDSDIVDYAIDREKDSVLFYIEIKDHLPAKDRDAVERIIDEERHHIVKLLDIKEKIG